MLRLVLDVTTEPEWDHVQRPILRAQAQRADRQPRSAGEPGHGDAVADLIVLDQVKMPVTHVVTSRDLNPMAMPMMPAPAEARDKLTPIQAERVADDYHDDDQERRPRHRQQQPR